MSKVPNIVQKKFSFFAISLAIIILGVVLAVTVGANFGVEFVGGIEVNATFTFKDDAEYDSVKLKIIDELKLLKLTVNDGQRLDNGVVFTLPNEIDGKKIDASVVKHLNGLINGALGENKDAAVAALKPFLGDSFKFDDYKGVGEMISGHEVEVNADSASATMDDYAFIEALIAFGTAIVVVMAYLSIRFWKTGKFVSALAILVTVVHDVLILIAFILFAGWLLKMPIGGTFIAAVATVVCFSINNVIVVFDRIRENNKLRDGESADYLVNMSVRDVFKHTLITAGVMIIVMTVVAAIGDQMIRSFAIPVIVGLLAGTYSTFFIASPLWAMFRLAVKDKHKEKPTNVKETN